MSTDSTPQPSGDDLAARIFAETGKFIIETASSCDIGEILDPRGWQGSYRGTSPLRVIAVATRDELVAQRRLIHDWTGLKILAPEWPYIYRAEAAD